MSKVMLVNPSNNLLSEIHPIGLLCLGSYLEKKGHTVMISDEAIGHNTPLLAKWFKPDVVGLSGLTPFIPKAYSLCNILKDSIDYRVMGGVHATALPDESIKFCDAVVTGEGEKTFVDIIESRKTGIIKGESVNKLDEILPLDYSLVDMSRYSKIRMCQDNSIWSFVLPMDRTCGVFSSRGCPFKCIFCHNSYTNIKIRFREIDSLIDELRSLKNMYNIDAVHFIDDTLLMNKKLVEKLCSRLKEEKLGMYFSCSGRANDITDDILEVLKSGGCAQIAFGFESANQRILDILKKEITVEDSVNAIELCNKHGIIIQGSFMFGNPTETLTEMKNTVKFIKEHYMDGGIGTFITTPYPGTKLWEWCVYNNLIPRDLSWDKLSFHKTFIQMHRVSPNIFLELMRNTIRLAFDLFHQREENRINKTKEIKKGLISKRQT